MENPRLLFVHAHPDDETLTTGATIAHYVARGARVQVVTCTLGEEGEVIGERLAQLAVDHADQLGGYRIAELSWALAELGVDGPRFLGGAGRWRDSGWSAPRRATGRGSSTPIRPSRSPRSSPSSAICGHTSSSPTTPMAGTAIPTTSTPIGVTTAAVTAAASPGHPGEPWQVSKFYWTVTARSAVDVGMRELAEMDLPDGWVMASADEFRFAYDDADIDAIVEAPGSRDAKVSALRAHATQVTVDSTGRACALSNDVALPIPADEHFVLAAGTAGERDGRGWETDLLAGLNLG